MIVFAVAVVLSALAVAVILVSVTVRNCGVCPRRRALVDIVNGRCQDRATCLDAPVGCERECITLDHFATRAGG